MPKRRPDGQSEADRKRDKRLLREWISEADTLDRRLITAVSDGDLHTVEVLLDREEGADPCARVNAEDRYSVLSGSVLHLAIQKGDLGIVQSLLRAGAVAVRARVAAARPAGPRPTGCRAGPHGCARTGLGDLAESPRIAEPLRGRPAHPARQQCVGAGPAGAGHPMALT